MLNSKKNQISIFAIIGVIIVISLVFLFFSSNFGIYFSEDAKTKSQVTDTVNQCLKDTADRGAFLLGFQGGRIYIPPQISQDPRRYVDLGFKIPNWDSEFGDIPTINSMEEELERYVKENAYTCIQGNLDTLKENYEFTTADEMVVDANINDNNIIVESTFPITFSQVNEDSSTSISDYYVKLENLRLGSLFKLAKQIYEKEANTYFMENLVIDQIRSASNYNSQLSMPTEGVSISCGKNVWTYPQLKENLKRLNNNNFKYLQFQETQSKDDMKDTNLGDNNQQYFNKQYTFSLPGENREEFKNFGTQIMFPSTTDLERSSYGPLDNFREFDVTPSSGGVVESMEYDVDMASTKIPVPCIQVYHHLYTLDYDLMVKLNDNHEDSGGYFFQFPLRINIEDNTPKDTPSELTSTLSPEEKPTATDEKFCSNSSRRYPTKVFARDESSGDYLSGVNLSYKCVALDCEIGETKKPTYDFDPSITRRNANPYYEGKFPHCVRGTLVGEKEGYHKATKKIDTTEETLDEPNTPYHELDMIPLKEFDVSKSTFLLVDKDTGDGKRVFDKGDGSIYLNIESEKYDFEDQVIWPNNGDMFNTIKLLDTNDVAYNVTVYYTDSDQNLKGMLTIENWKNPEIHQGNRLEVTIPYSSSEITKDNYRSFNEYVKKAAKGETYYDYGINII